MKRGFVSFCSMAVMLVAGAPALAQDFPTKAMRIVTGGTGGAADISARQIAAGMTQTMGQIVIVENKGSGYAPGQTVARANADGYTILFTTAIFWIEPLIRRQAPYDAVADFVPITQAMAYPNVLMVNPALPAKTLRELIDLAKAKPGFLNYGTTSSGGSAHIAGELLKTMGGIDIVRIPYKGGGEALVDLMSGRIHIYFATVLSADSYIKSGRLRALAVTSAKPSSLLPNVPPLAATLPGYESTSIAGFFAPAKTPPRIVNLINQGIVKALREPSIAEKFLNVGAEPVGGTPQEFAATVKAEIGRLNKLIKEADIKPND